MSWKLAWVPPLETSLCSKDLSAHNLLEKKHWSSTQPCTIQLDPNLWTNIPKFPLPKQKAPSINTAHLGIPFDISFYICLGIKNSKSWIGRTQTHIESIRKWQLVVIWDFGAKVCKFCHSNVFYSDPLFHFTHLVQMFVPKHWDVPAPYWERPTGRSTIWLRIPSILCKLYLTLESWSREHSRKEILE